jgi:alkylation response protein AidB-like acyl-CoA dehydrogenase
VDCTVLPVWDALGMRGTASHDVVVDGVFVPAERMASGRWLRAQPGRLYHPRLGGVITWAPTVGVALGLARGALDAMADLAGHTSTGSGVPLGERVEVQRAVGRAEAVVASARAFAVEAIGAAWEAVEPGADADPRAVDTAVARARLAITHGMTEAIRAIEALAEVTGTPGVLRVHGLERRWRDAVTASRHAAGLVAHVEAAGRVLLGLPAAAPLF